MTEVILRAWCPSGHSMQIFADAKQDGPDGEVVVCTMDKDEATCSECGQVLGDE